MLKITRDPSDDKMMNLSNYTIESSPTFSHSVSQYQQLSPSFNNIDIDFLDSCNKPTLEESSFELPIDDNLFFDETSQNTQTTSKLEDNWTYSIPLDQTFASNPDMTFKEYTDELMEQNDDYIQLLDMNPGVPTIEFGARTPSVGSVSDDNERDDVNRRGLKKSGGPVRKMARFGNKQVVKYSDEYHDRRVKNNEAVKKSRMKAKQKQNETATKMEQLASENLKLNGRVELLMKELQVLKSLYRELSQDIPSSAVKELEKVNIR